MSKYIQKLIDQREHQQQDFKFAINDSKKIARTLSAFANTDGGRLLIGVKDNGVIVGANSDEEYYMVEAGAQLYCKPEVEFQVYKWTIEGKIVLEIVVDKSCKRPHLAQNKEKQYVAYIRVGDENIIAPSILVKSWINKTKQTAIHNSDRYQYIIQLLNDYKKITFIQLCKIAFMSEQEMEQILIDLLSINLITVEHVDSEFLFVLNSD